MQKWLVTLMIIMSPGVVVLNAQQNDKQQQVDKIVKDFHEQLKVYSSGNQRAEIEQPEGLTKDQLEKWEDGQYSMNEFYDIIQKNTIDKIEKVTGKPLTEEQIKILTESLFTTPKPQFVDEDREKLVKEITSPTAAAVNEANAQPPSNPGVNPNQEVEGVQETTPSTSTPSVDNKDAPPHLE